MSKRVRSAEAAVPEESGVGGYMQVQMRHKDDRRRTTKREAVLRERHKGNTPSTYESLFETQFSY